VTNPADGLDIPRAKLAKAREHQAAFQKCLEDWIEGDSFDLQHDHDPSTGWNEVRYKVKTEPPTQELALILGDITTNARGALDYVVWQLVLVADTDEPGHHTMFPVVKKAADWLSTAKHRLRGVAPEWVKVIEEAQPFNQPDPKINELLALDAANNYGKHRTIPLALASAEPSQFTIKTVPGMKYDFEPIDEWLVDDAVVLRVKPEDKSRLEILEAGINVRVGFDDGSGIRWDTEHMLTWLEDYIERFAPAFESSPPTTTG